MNLRAKIEALEPEEKYYFDNGYYEVGYRRAIADVLAVMNAEKKIHITPSIADALFPLTVDYEHSEIRDARGFWVAVGCCEHWKLEEIVRRANFATATATKELK